MIDVVVLNRNLGTVCDALCESAREIFGKGTNLVVVDCSTSDELASTDVTVRANWPEAIEQGLRFGRGMNAGLQAVLKQGSKHEWVLLLPVDTEIVGCNVKGLLAGLDSIPDLVAVKPLPVNSAYEELLGSLNLSLGWNFEEGPWLLKKDFVKSQMSFRDKNEFFDHSNFRGYMTSLDISLRAYANGFCVGLTKDLVLRENETYLMEKSELMKTEPMSENDRLFLIEGVSWLKSRYGIEDPWDFAQLVRLSFERYMLENPEYQKLALVGRWSNEDR
jgi:hypothetical protein